MNAGERAVEGGTVEAVALDDFGARLRVAELCRLPREAPDGAAAFFESSTKTAADISGRAREQDSLVHHGAYLSVGRMTASIT